MKKYLIKVIIWLLILLGIYLADGYIKKQEAVKHSYQEVFLAKYELEYSNPIQAIDFMKIEIANDFYHEDMLTKLPEGYLTTSINAKQILLENQVSKQPLFKIEKAERLITIKCSVVEANGWHFRTGDYVDLVMVPINAPKIILENLKVYQMFGSIKESTLKEYISLIVSEEDAYMYYHYLKDSQVFVSVKSLN